MPGVEPASVSALAFDVFGTVVDWRTTIVREGRELSRRTGSRVDWPAFADAWRAGYRPAIDRVRSGARPWTTVDVLHREILDDLLDRFGLSELEPDDVAHLNRVWHRLDPWPDAIPGLDRLRRRFVVAALSNGNVSLLVRMAKHAGLPWDVILSAELARSYKPDPEVYRTAARLLDLEPEEILMVAAHPPDLRGAAGVGFRTAYVPRPAEHGPGPRARGGPGGSGSAPAGEGEGADRLRPDDPEDGVGSFDLVARDFVDLAELLGT